MGEISCWILQKNQGRQIREQFKERYKESKENTKGIEVKAWRWRKSRKKRLYKKEENKRQILNCGTTLQWNVSVKQQCLKRLLVFCFHFKTFAYSLHFFYFLWKEVSNFFYSTFCETTLQSFCSYFWTIVIRLCVKSGIY